MSLRGHAGAERSFATSGGPSCAVRVVLSFARSRSSVFFCSPPSRTVSSGCGDERGRQVRPRLPYSTPWPTSSSSRVLRKPVQFTDDRVVWREELAGSGRHGPTPAVDVIELRYREAAPPRRTVAIDVVQDGTPGTDGLGDRARLDRPPPTATRHRRQSSSWARACIRPFAATAAGPSRRCRGASGPTRRQAAGRLALDQQRLAHHLVRRPHRVLPIR